jgi:hypothetical protein
LRGAVVSTMAAPALWVIRVDFGMPVGIRLAAYLDASVHVDSYNQTSNLACCRSLKLSGLVNS